MRYWKHVRTSLLVALACSFAYSALAREPNSGETIEGVIIHQDLVGEPRHVVVREADGQEVRVRVHVSTKIAFDSRNSDLSPEISNLRPGVRVRVGYTGNEPAQYIEVLDVPADVRRDAQQTATGLKTRKPDAVAAAGASSGQELKVRLLGIDGRRGEIRADVAGRAQRFQLEDPKMLASFNEGDLVIVRVRDSGGTQVVTDMRSAAMAGRVISVDKNRKEIRVSVDGQEQTYVIERKELLDNVRTGDHIRFDSEERSTGQRVITSVNRD
jgi:hypothetical protein